jgi:hypothetical protein
MIVEEQFPIGSYGTAMAHGWPVLGFLGCVGLAMPILRGSARPVSSVVGRTVRTLYLPSPGSLRLLDNAVELLHGLSVPFGE